MTDTEFAKLKLLRAIYPNIDYDKLEKYFCTACQNFDCRKNISMSFTQREKHDSVRFHLWEGNGLKRLVVIYKCFEGEKK